MVVIASRQTGERPETIRTRLARFMPRAAAGWSVGWSAQTERADEVGSEEELSAAEHVGCYGTAVAHALAQAEVPAARLQVTAMARASSDGSPQPIMVEIRARIPGPAIDAGIVETIARRAEPNCPQWRALVSGAGMHITALLEDSAAAATEGPASKPRSGSGKAAAVAPQPPRAAPMPRVSGSRLSLPGSVSPKMVLVIVGIGVVILKAFPLFFS